CHQGVRATRLRPLQHRRDVPARAQAATSDRLTARSCVRTTVRYRAQACGHKRCLMSCSRCRDANCAATGREICRKGGVSAGEGGTTCCSRNSCRGVTMRSMTTATAAPEGTTDPFDVEPPYDRVADDLPTDRFLDRELSWLWFNRRVLELAEDPDLPL